MPAERIEAAVRGGSACWCDDLCIMPLLYYSYHNLVSTKLKGWEDNVMDVHPSRFISKE